MLHIPTFLVALEAVCRARPEPFEAVVKDLDQRPFVEGRQAQGEQGWNRPGVRRTPIAFERHLAFALEDDNGPSVVPLLTVDRDAQVDRATELGIGLS